MPSKIQPHDVVALMEDVPAMHFLTHKPLQLRRGPACSRRPSELLTADPPPQSYGETRTLVTEIPEKEKTPPMPPGGMGGMDY